MLGWGQCLSTSQRSLGIAVSNLWHTLGIDGINRHHKDCLQGLPDGLLGRAGAPVVC